MGEKAFHHQWEVRANSLYAHAVRRGLFNMDEYRHAIERREPRHYLAASYYERSLTSLAAPSAPGRPKTPLERPSSPAIGCA